MAGRRVLVIDDEENIGRSLRLILEREGYSVGLCHSVAGFRDYLGRPDVYLIDVRLPDGNGIDLLRINKRVDVHSPVAFAAQLVQFRRINDHILVLGVLIARDNLVVAHFAMDRADFFVPNAAIAFGMKLVQMNFTTIASRGGKGLDRHRHQAET